MDPRVNQMWTSSEVEEARSLIARLNNDKIIYGNNDDNNKKHNDIVDALHALFPSKTVQQVIELYVDLFVEMHNMKGREEIHVSGGSTHNVCTGRDLVNGNFGESGKSGASGTHNVCTTVGLVQEYNFGVQEEATTMGDTALVFGCPLEDTRIMDMEEALPMVEKNNMVVLENNIANDKPIMHIINTCSRYQFTIKKNEVMIVCNHVELKCVPNPLKKNYKPVRSIILITCITINVYIYVVFNFSKLFLRGLRVYGRGDWKNISKYFVTTKTAVQVSSHAQKYFKRLEKRTLFGKSGRQHYSINDVGLDDDLWASENSSGPWQALASTGLNNDPSSGSQAPASLFVMNDLSQSWAPIISSQQVGHEPVWSEQQIMASVAALMEGVGTFMPACQQGSAYFPPGNV
ncbi:unnamed protein product [Alopecurus aequalis]